MSATATETITATASSSLPLPKARPPKIDFSSVNPNNLGTLRKLNQVLFPIRYSEKFYKDVLLPEHEEFCKLIYYNDIPVGDICCRIESDPNDETKSRLYIMTMGVLAPYRSRKVGSKGLEHVIENAIALSQKKDAPKALESIYLHVQTSNDDARRFYEKHGFREVGRVDGYYKKLEPHDAWVLEKVLTESTEERP
ncbi:hypothetical protein FRC01_009039 [Tulasnella sp. 417]|nr:hypothetical protein FRC01_009039 [Tulasnella sp. 417]